MQRLFVIVLCIACMLPACSPVEGRSRDKHRVVDPSTGQLLLEAEWADGHLHGEFRTWYACGEPREQGVWEHGLPVGVRTRWHATGYKAEQGSFAGGLREGPWPRWYENGQPEWTGSWKSGARQGTWTHFAHSGAVLEVEQWEQGTRLSIARPQASSQLLAPAAQGTPDLAGTSSGS